MESDFILYLYFIVSEVAKPSACIPPGKSRWDDIHKGRGRSILNRKGILPRDLMHWVEISGYRSTRTTSIWLSCFHKKTVEYPEGIQYSLGESLCNVRHVTDRSYLITPVTGSTASLVMHTLSYAVTLFVAFPPKRAASDDDTALGGLQTSKSTTWEGFFRESGDVRKEGRHRRGWRTAGGLM